MVHQPVLVLELLELLAIQTSGVYVDGTLGGGGHAVAVLQKAGGEAALLGIDRDAEILASAGETLKDFKNQIRIRKGNFSDITEILEEEKLGTVDGIYLDLGISSLQVDRPERGFSFSKEGPVDMRMDPSQGAAVLDKIKTSREPELTRVLKEYGEECYAPKIARRIFEVLRRGELQTTLDLAQIAWDAYPPPARHRGIHPATRTFQALRIWVNEELDHLQKFLDRAPLCLKPGGRLCVMSYHSLEDRLVKHGFRNLAKTNPAFKVLTKKPITPSEEEKARNPRSRSAKLRGLERRCYSERSHSERERRHSERSEESSC